MLTGTIVELSNVSYGSFPDADTLISLSTNLVISFIDFIRTIGINSREQMANAFESSLEDIDRLCLKCHLNPEANTKESIDYRVGLRKKWQQKILKGSAEHFEINLKEILETTRKRSPYYKIDAYANEVSYRLTTLLRYINNSAKAKGIVNTALVNQIIANCHLDPIRSWREARETTGYIRTLLTEIFPYIPESVIASYLFTVDSPSPQEIANFCTKHGIRRKIKPDSGRHEEEIAFAKWIKYDVRQFIIERAEKDRSWQKYIY